MPGSGLHQFENLGRRRFLDAGLSVSFFRDLEWFLLREDYFRMSPGHPISVEREANSRQVLEYSERKRSLKKTQVEANFYFRSQENSTKYYIK